MKPRRRRAEGLRSSRRRFVRPLLPLAALLLLACGGRRLVPDPQSDLLRDLSLASVSHPAESGATWSVAFGTPAARGQLGAGWSQDQWDRRYQSPFVWGFGARSTLRLSVDRVRDLILELRCQPVKEAGAAGRRLGVELNGQPIAELELSRGLRLYRTPLPATALRPGRNWLVFRYGSEGARPAARAPVVTFYGLTLVDPALEPRATPDGRLEIPFGTQVDWFLPVAAGAELRWQGLEASDGDGAQLALSMASDEAGERPLGVVNGVRGPGGVTLGVDRPLLVRLSLRASARSEGHPGHLTLIRPALWMPTDPPHPAEARFPRSSAALGHRPNILIYLVDTLRPDRLGCYGGPPQIAPRIDAFAASSTLFANAFGQSSWTKASVASLLTGLWPPAHGAINRRDMLSPEAETLAERLRDAGYRTAGIVAQPNVAEAFGFAQGFDTYRQVSGNTPSSELTRQAADWIDRRDRTAPFFLYVQSVDPHDPYVPPEPLAERLPPDTARFLYWMVRTPRAERFRDDPETIRHLRVLYDAEISANDQGFGELLDYLREQGLYDDTLLVFLSDHGEEFHEHGRWTHGKNLHSETLDVALVVKFPGQRQGLRVSQPVQHVDLMPTVLEYLGLERSPRLRGRSLIAGIDHRGVAGPVFSHLELDGPQNVSVVLGEWKLIEVVRAGVAVERHLFHWPTDRAEEHDLGTERPITAQALSTLLAAKLADDPLLFERRRGVIDRDLRQSLRALGYLP